jgi:hypothetical protein
VFSLQTSPHYRTNFLLSSSAKTPFFEKKIEQNLAFLCGGEGVKNWPKLRDVLYGRPLNSFLNPAAKMNLIVKNTRMSFTFFFSV